MVENWHNMIKLKTILEQSENGVFYEWTRDFDLFNNTVKAATETAMSRFQNALKSKILNKTVIVRASKAQPKQPVKDYTIQRVIGVSIIDFHDEWVVVLKNESNKEFCLVPGYKLKILGGGVTAEPGTATTPTEPEPTTPVQPTPTTPPKPTTTGVPQQNTPPLPPQPIKEVSSPYVDTLGEAIHSIEEYVVKNSDQLYPDEHPTSESDPFGVREPFLYGSISYEETKKADYKLMTYRGKPTKKYLHVTIYRMDSGKYEVTIYVL